MEQRMYVDQIRAQGAALRAVAVEAGPAARVPTCPEWTVLDLVAHIARVHSRTLIAADTAPDAERPHAQRPPAGWDELLPWWDDLLERLVERLANGDPDQPAWVFAPGLPRTLGFWIRRQAHETAIHRLDAEHAVLGRTVSTLLFDPGFAADGVAEGLDLAVLAGSWEQSAEQGLVLLHAADAGDAWQVRLRAGTSPEIAPAEATEADVTVAGTADAVYRMVWRRPSTAVVTGDANLLETLRTP